MAWIIQPGFLRDIFKGTVTAIVKEKVAFALHAPGSALHEHAAKLAEFFIAAEFGQLVHVDMNIARDKQIDVPIAIVVAPGCSQAQSTARDSGLFRDIFEFAVAQIVVEDVAAITSYVNVRKTIVVVVGNGNSHSPALTRESGLLGDVGELEICVLMIEGDHRVAALFPVAIHVRAVDGDDVEFAVVVAIDQTDSSAHRLDDVALIRGRDVGDSEAGLRADVLKARQSLRRRGCLRDM